MKIVLIEPDIPWNAGNIGRTCVATGTELVFVGKMGFSLSDKAIRRSGLDYWQFLKYAVFPDLYSFLCSLPENPSLLFFSTRGAATHWQAPYREDSCLIFGAETAGFPEWIYEKYADKLYRIPMCSDRVRSINLSTAAGIVLYEALRQVRPGGFPG
ncbi:MAG: tRNA (uridine(34)/cytosine(34)/5-carboxymethylaminomethyluridine(34)-2'-O)-methyltransferase TrmL [Elusimicrobia bacterium RIFOXYA2_FULL_58_8]|nr:MAG: tRNA (uridine(34)/cytosine(34)/5-carboxymethylaminomethyluridine(34)-2'-O)-methyltransferase TrmL [Elusimicrobia bacterium RIFOXYA12_FULL_57_11]OGS16143.1 MAG: tRNA (uridine(34)/cytosine(34)/5-carboxymethylaminomethyluridine(34)-2'-O)-methyltransferase TrmL [Elusimicrobia bacterium RIFOXYA2_FULL_58_8]